MGLNSVGDIKRGQRVSFGAKRGSNGPLSLRSSALKEGISSARLAIVLIMLISLMNLIHADRQIDHCYVLLSLCL